ncbi:hypothetical protein [Sutcliffiella horikoshii]|uniref:hypothetical protein n=1 Tax=Sutcliffiella horikoshii TaxID=79883 RepID=UPI001F4005C3|nr:hypothetical protein [Sutcliffiella horikoshii]MCG1023587.1 hypothetical protein [Sutcliffiella horikoshii]
MKETIWIIFFSLVLAACASTKEPILKGSSEEASWAYEFVRVKETSYKLTQKEAEEGTKGDLIGEVQRNIVDMDSAEESVEQHLDSNSLPHGTALYKHTGSKSIILYELEDKYYIAEKKD